MSLPPAKGLLEEIGHCSLLKCHLPLHLPEHLSEPIDHLDCAPPTEIVLEIPQGQFALDHTNIIFEVPEDLFEAFGSPLHDADLARHDQSHKQEQQLRGAQVDHTLGIQIREDPLHGLQKIGGVEAVQEGEVVLFVYPLEGTGDLRRCRRTFIMLSMSRGSLSLEYSSALSKL